MSYDEEEREQLLRQMRLASQEFYRAAVKIGVHPFLEVNGLLAKLIDLYQRMHKEGIDFGTEDLKAEPHDMSYVAEKIDCIFGKVLEDPLMRATFLRSLAIEGYWSPQRKAEPL